MDDDALLAAGDYATLFAKYESVVLGRCRARIRNRYDAEDVAQMVWLRIFGELERGVRYPLPFQFALHNIVTWTIAAYFQRQRIDDPIDDHPVEDGTDPFANVHDCERLVELFSHLPAGQREVCELRYLEGLEIDQVAARLEITRNAVDQRLHNAHKKLRELLEGD